MRMGQRKRSRLWLRGLIILILLLFLWVEKNKVAAALYEEILRETAEEYMPVVPYLLAKANAPEMQLNKKDSLICPVFSYVSVKKKEMKVIESNEIYEELLRLEGTEEFCALTVEEAGNEEEERELEETSLQENVVAGAVQEDDENSDAQTTEAETMTVTVEEDKTYPQLRCEKSMEYDLSQYKNLEELVKNFYIVDSTTGVDEQRLNIDFLAVADMTLKQTNDQPQILIYHTHSLEGYADSLPGDENSGVMGAGEELARILREEYGYNVIHHKGRYDTVVRDQAYSYAEDEIGAILEENPTIEVVIDLHRDEVREGVHLVTDINGIPCARFMFFNGLSYSKSLGAISYLPNPYIEDNLAFSFQAQKISGEYYPGLSRGIYLRAYRYNMHFRPKNMLIELGAQSNTEQEVRNTVPILAHILSSVLK